MPGPGAPFSLLARSRHAVRSRDSPRHGPARGRVRAGVPRGVDADARRDRRRAPALLREARARHRPRVQHDHDHRGRRTARRGNASSPGFGPATSANVDDEGRHDAPRRHEQGPRAGRSGRRSRSVELANVPTGGDEHDATLFMEDTAWPHAGKLEEYLAAARDNYAPSLAEGRHGGRSLLELEAVLTAGVGHQRAAARGHPLAAGHEAGRDPRAADQRDPGRAPRPGHLDARRAEGPRRLGEPAAPHVDLVATGLMPVHPGLPVGGRRRRRRRSAAGCRGRDASCRVRRTASRAHRRRACGVRRLRSLVAWARGGQARRTALVGP